MKEDFSILNTLEQISSSKLISVMKPVFIRMFPDLVRIVRRNKEILQLQKFSSLGCVEILSFPSEILDLNGEKKSENIRQFQSEIKKSIEVFDQTITMQMPHFNRAFLYKNLETLSVQEVDFIETWIEALYDHDSNTILLLAGVGIKHLYHELFHVASFRKFKGVVASGFMQFAEGNAQTLIGRGLTEGYTQILTERYFRNYNIAEKHYLHLAHFSSHLEMIVGRVKMERLYSNADLYHLIEELEQYESKNHILEFLKNLDMIELLASRTRGVGDFRKEYCQKALSNVVSFLVKCRTLQLKRDFSLGFISEHDLEISVNSFLDSITCIDFKNLYGDVYEVDLSDADMKVVDKILYEEVDADVSQQNQRGI